MLIDYSKNPLTITDVFSFDWLISLDHWIGQKHFEIFFRFLFCWSRARRRRWPRRRRRRRRGWRASRTFRFPATKWPKQIWSCSSGNSDHSAFENKYTHINSLAWISSLLKPIDDIIIILKLSQYVFVTSLGFFCLFEFEFKKSDNFYWSVTWTPLIEPLSSFATSSWRIWLTVKSEIQSPNLAQITPERKNPTEMKLETWQPWTTCWLVSFLLSVSVPRLTVLASSSSLPLSLSFNPK